jgi:hypothetical protein
MKTSYIDLNLLDKITVINKIEKSFEWNEKILPTHKTFLGIKYHKTEGKSEGWGNNRLSTKELLRYYSTYEVDEENKVVYERPNVLLELSNDQWYEQYFDTYEEADEYAFKINQESGKNLYPIEHN